MPLYDYACTKCGHAVEVRHGFNETHAAPCPQCGAPVRRVFNAAPILFKGSGFYVTDSRRSVSASKPGEPAKSGPAKSEPAKSEPAKHEAPASTAQPKSESKPSDSAA
jgi:putative FmdB family regulatory protein